MPTPNPRSSFIPLSLVLQDFGVYPHDVAEPQGGLSVLDHVGVSDVGIVETPTQTTAHFTIVFDDELAFDIPGLSGVSFVFGANGTQSAFPIEIDLRDPVQFRLTSLSVGLRFASTVIQPVVLQDGRYVPDAAHSYVEIDVTGALAVDSNGIRIDGMNELSLTPSMIGSSGVVIEASHIELHLSPDTPLPPATAAGLPAGWTGVYIASAAVHLPPDLGPAVPSGLTISDCFIGTGGFTGALDVDWPSPGFGGTLAGVDFRARRFHLALRENTFVDTALTGTLQVPFFDEPLGLDLGFSATGAFTASISDPSGHIELRKDGVLSLQLEALRFALADGTFTLGLTGTITPLFPGDWPGFRVDDLSIDSHGNVHIAGGWINLREQYSVDFHAFRVEISRLGMGRTDDGGNWMGFSGGIRLVEGLPAGASVEGLRLIWYPDGHTRVTFNGVRVNFEVPDVIRFSGSVAYHELPGDIHRFDGAIRLELLSLGMTVDAVLVIGTNAGSPFFAIYVDAELPAGIPLASTGLSLFGLAGLFAAEMAPNKGAAPNELHPTSRTDESWYDNPDGSPGWYKRTNVGVTDLASKWDPVRGSVALGAGVTIGTNDNGFTFSAKVLLAIVLPGPIILIEGRANLLKSRAQLSDDPMFRALAVIDGREGTLLIGIDALYRYGNSGELIDITAGAEGFFDFNHGDRWHIYLGVDDPRSRRIRANILRLFEANAYFMIDARQIKTGAWIGIDEHWSFGPLSVTLSGWMEGSAILSWKPEYFEASLALHGEAGLSVFGFGLSLTLDASVMAHVFKPKHVRAELSVGIGLPWPLPDFNVDITLEWTEPGQPDVPLPVKDVAIEHFKSTTAWPLPRKGPVLLLRPDFDMGDGFLDVGSTADPSSDPPPAEAPIVPLDARPRITFTRAVNDDAIVGVNAQPVLPSGNPPQWEWIGDPSRNEGPARVRYSIRNVVLHKWNGSSWTETARVNPTAGLRPIYGSWAPVPQLPTGTGTAGTDLPVANDKLWIWSKTPFDYTRNTGNEWDDWFLGTYPHYPCIPPAADVEVCLSFDGEPPRKLESPFTNPLVDAVTIDWRDGNGRITPLRPPRKGHTEALCIPMQIGNTKPSRATLHFQRPARRVRISVIDDPVAQSGCIDFRNRPVLRGPNILHEAGITFTIHDKKGENPAEVIRQLGVLNAVVTGLNCGDLLEIALPVVAETVDLTLISQEGGAAIEALDASGATVAHATTTRTGTANVLSFNGAITALRVASAMHDVLLFECCFEAAPQGLTTVTIHDGDVVRIVPGTDGNFEALGSAISTATIDRSGGLCILEICATLPPDPHDVTQRNELASHLQQELAVWSSEDELLQPYTQYRLQIVTRVEAVGTAPSSKDLNEYAYFRTEGPPGVANLSLPLTPPTPDDSILRDAAGALIDVIGAPSAVPVLKTDLATLVPYVRQTIPPTISPEGKAILPRPVYRTYDVRVEFNENYVATMYRSSGRDLGLYLFDHNQQLVRDTDGRLLSDPPSWDAADVTVLSEGERRWIEIVNGSACSATLSLDPANLPPDSALADTNAAKLLEPDSVYEARLIPLLLHDDFSAATLARWTILDTGTTDAPSHWTLGTSPSPYVEQTSAIWTSMLPPADHSRPGTILLRAPDPQLAGSHPDQPSNWTDYRVSLYVRITSGSAGVLFRYRNGANWYRFATDLTSRRLTRRAGSAYVELGVEMVATTPGRDVQVTIEVIGSAIRVYCDGRLSIEASDATHAAGAVALYSFHDSGSRFKDLRCDDLRASAPVPYRFKFATSRYSNFIHHLGSYDDVMWPVEVPASTPIAPQLAHAVTPVTLPSEDEARAYDALADLLLGADAHRDRDHVECLRLATTGSASVYHLATSEPLDWSRTTLTAFEATSALPAATSPHDVKIIDVTFGATAPIEESLAILARDRTDLNGARLLFRNAPPVPEVTDVTSGGDWMVHHEFGAEPLVPGAGIRLFSGNATAAPAAEAGVTQRFVAVGTDAGTIHFSASAVDVMLVARDGRVLHARRFLRPSAYSELNVGVLRKRDGTAFFIAPASGTFATDTLRIVLQFHRDNRAADPSSLLLSAGGNIDPEIVTLDV